MLNIKQASCKKYTFGHTLLEPRAVFIPTILRMCIWEGGRGGGGMRGDVWVARRLASKILTAHLKHIASGHHTLYNHIFSFFWADRAELCYLLSWFRWMTSVLHVFYLFISDVGSKELATGGVAGPPHSSVSPSGGVAGPPHSSVSPSGGVGGQVHSAVHLPTSPTGEQLWQTASCPSSD
jgi:hypothetical protein